MEDAPADAEICELELRRANLRFVTRRVESESSFLEAIRDFRPDLIIADNSLPGFSGYRALELALRECPGVPFLFVSGSVGEEEAIKVVKMGATDYILKDHLSRLATAVERALKEAAERRLRREAEEALHRSEERYALAVAGANDGIWDWDLSREEVYFSERWSSMVGCLVGEVGKSPDEWFRRIHPEDLARMKRDLEEHLGGRSPTLETEYRLRHRAKGYRWMLARGVAVRDPAGTICRIVGSQTDIHARKLAEEQLAHDAFHDPLTGLANRALFLDRLSQRIRRAEREEPAPFAVLFLDLDRFKLVNDSLGHELGDELLREVAQRLAKTVRPADTVGRLGGDEFAILLDAVRDARGAALVVRRMQRSLKAPFALGTHEVFATASVGVAMGEGTQGRAEDLLRDADTAMYRAKSEGRDRHAVFEPSMRAEVVRTLSIDAELRRALERSELEVHYQPIVVLDSGALAGFEALVRWRDARRGLVPPAEFIPVAEETGLVVAIDRWVLGEACRQLAEWRKDHPGARELYVTVNLSAKQFAHPGLLEHVDATLGKTGLPGDALGVEITESALMGDRESAARTLSELRLRGVRCYLDDFGTGYSSMSYLYRLPIDALKIDRSFVAGLGPGGEGQEIVRMISGLGASLGKKVIAEGIETAEHLAALRTLRCSYGQGYHFSRPLPKADASRLLGGNTHWSSGLLSSDPKTESPG